MEKLKQAVRNYALRHRNHDGLALTPVPGLKLKCVEAPQGRHYAVLRPLVVFVLQGAKRMTIGLENRTITVGHSAIVSVDMPVVTHIERASPEQPYLAVAVELEMAMLAEAATYLAPARTEGRAPPLFADDAEAAALDCVMRLVGLCDRPAAIALLRPGIMLELHYWLLRGPHGADLGVLCDPASQANRLAAAIAILRTEFRTRISVERLAAEAGMGLSTFHTHFRRLLSLSPGQYQKRLRLIEARRLMLEEGVSASSAAYEVGYESVSQFTREYARLFNAPPKRDAQRARSASGGLGTRAGDGRMPGPAVEAGTTQAAPPR
ncbi:AraC family transcriptional regulator [Methylobrevis albus]|uniref:AraC family transcriptional regulator n=1 Tax=Methylobrevis albus TaxID=2793297 RepID=A0A931I330_9HYPH|nr:AraC family transcriptional regulator [Methylobrevis albus]MBH0238011.1 AraC family transcriptional regulator [Methylobrevis albus]